MIKNWNILSSHYCVESPWFRLRKDTVELPDNTVIDDYYTVEKPEVAVVCALTTEMFVLFVRQYKHGVQRTTLELPAGLADPQENALQCAKRELGEETGYSSQRWLKLGSFFDDTSRNDNYVYPFLACNAEKHGYPRLEGLEEQSGIETVLVPLDRINEKIDNQEIQAMSTVSTLYHAMRFIELR